MIFYQIRSMSYFLQHTTSCLRRIHAFRGACRGGQAYLVLKARCALSDQATI